jgi:hypothetical protein
VNQEFISKILFTGLITFCGVPNNPNIFLASTYHKSVYSIKIESLSTGEMVGNEGQLLDEGRLLDEMVDGLQQLDDINQEIRKQQEFHRVLSIAARGPLLFPHFSLKLQVVQSKFVTCFYFISIKPLKL